MSATEEQVRYWVRDELRKIIEKLYMKNWRITHKEHVRQYTLEYRAAHIEERRVQGRIKYYRTREKQLERRRKWHKENRKKSLAQMSANFHLPKADICEFCGSERNVVRHHLDYDYPLLTVSICRVCHSWAHKDVCEVIQ